MTRLYYGISYFNKKVSVRNNFKKLMYLIIWRSTADVSLSIKLLLNCINTFGSEKLFLEHK